MQEEEEKKIMTMASLCAFHLFDNDHVSNDIKEKDEKKKGMNDDNDDNNDKASKEVNVNKEDSTHDNNEEEEEEDINAMKQMRHFPNVAFSRFITNQSSSIFPKQDTNKNTTTNISSNTNSNVKTIPFEQFYPKITTNTQYQNINKTNHFCSSTQHSSINSSYLPSQQQQLPQNRMHKTVPLQSSFMRYPQYGFNNSNFLYPIQSPYLNNKECSNIKYFNNNHMSMQYINPDNSITSFSSKNIITKAKNASITPSLPIKEIDFDSLQSLISYLKGGKQIGNYIKCRNNSTTMINLLKKISQDETTELIHLILPKLKDIMISNNKFSQKLFEQCTIEQRLIILTAIKDDFIEIALNKWGSYSLQTLIKVVSLPEEQEIVKKCIEGQVFKLAMDKQANFVLQKLVLLLNEKGMSIIIDEIFAIFNHLIYNPTGISLLKNLILANKGSEIRKKFVLKVMEYLPNIINNSNGHTLILQIMDKWDYDTCKGMIGEIAKDGDKYASMRFGVIVVMKCVSISDQKMIKGIYTPLFRSESILKLFKVDSGRELIKEIFGKLEVKGRNEAYEMIEMTLIMIKKQQNEEKSRINEDTSMPKFIEDLMIDKIAIID